VSIEARGPVTWVRLTRPDKRNAITQAMAGDLRRALEAAAADDTVRVVVLTGTEGSFSSGADTNDLFGRDASTVGTLVGHRPEDAPIFPVDELVLFPKPTIAAVNGRAIGGGATMAMACDLRVCADDATLAFSLGKVGLTPEWGSSYLLWRQIGWGRALDVLLTCRTIGAEEAMALGLASRVVPATDLEAATQELAERIASLPVGTAEAIKDVLRQGLDSTFPDARQAELRALGRRGKAIAAQRRRPQAQQPDARSTPTDEPREHSQQ
jgi:2-(1,2-epoxy-1,2-dihydrophenyl)acetyl-CoA isomerase